MRVAEVGFYHLTRARLDDALPALLEKALAKRLRAVVIVRDAEQLRHLDAWLWTYRSDSFLPHGLASATFAERQPVLLTADVVNPNGADLLVIVDGVLPAADVPFARIVDLFDGNDEQALAGARDRWRTWRERRVEALVYYQQQDAGGWQKAREERTQDE